MTRCEPESSEWREALTARLLNEHRAGAWSYGPGLPPAAEPTALASLALPNAPGGAEAEAALDWLAAIQQPGGGVPAYAHTPHVCWPTSCALLAWSGSRTKPRFAGHIERAGAFVLSSKGMPAAGEYDYAEHDETLIGWSWAPGTHSWVEPTAWGVLALRAARQGAHPRCRDGVALLLDRAIPGGGWNYGNSTVLGQVLRPFPANTGLVLAALAGEPPDPRIEDGITNLLSELPQVRSAMSLAWGVIGLTAWNRRPPETDAWLERCALRRAAQAPAPLEDALLLIAGSPHLAGLGEVLASHTNSAEREQRRTAEQRPMNLLSDPALRLRSAGSAEAHCAR